MSVIVRITLCLYLGFLSQEPAFAQDSFTVQIECYNCVDRMSNTTCGEPKTNKDLGSLDTITCKHGACIKWTYYKSNELLMRRTCSQEINLKIPLNHVCQDESYGNGYLCMCDKDLCNGAASSRSSWSMFGSSFLMLVGAHKILIAH